MPTMRLAAVLAAVAILAAGCSDNGEDRDGAGTTTDATSTTTLGLAPGYEYTDCSKIRAGDTLDSKSFNKLLCHPLSQAELFTLDCVNGIYVLMRRPEGDLEAMLRSKEPYGPTAGVTKWQEAGAEDPALGHKTPFAFRECQER